MSRSLLPEPPADSELARWVEDGDRLEPSHSNIVAIDAPDEPYGLRVQLDDPVHGYLIDLYDDKNRLARTVVDDCETAGQIAAELAAAAPKLRELNERPGLGPERIDRIEVESERESPPTPDKWDISVKIVVDGWRYRQLETPSLPSVACRRLGLALLGWN